MAKTEPYLEHIESKEIRKLVRRLYQDQPDQSINKEEVTEKPQPQQQNISDISPTSSDTHDQIASEIDKLLQSDSSMDQYAEPTETPLPEFPATEKPKKIEKPERPEKKKGIFGFFKK